MAKPQTNSQSQVALTWLMAIFVGGVMWVGGCEKAPPSAVENARYVRELEAENHELRRRVEACEKTHYQGPALCEVPR